MIFLSVSFHYNNSKRETSTVWPHNCSYDWMRSLQPRIVETFTCDFGRSADQKDMFKSNLITYKVELFNNESILNTNKKIVNIFILHTTILFQGYDLIYEAYRKYSSWPCWTSSLNQWTVNGTRLWTWHVIVAVLPKYPWVTSGISRSGALGMIRVTAVGVCRWMMYPSSSIPLTYEQIKQHWWWCWWLWWQWQCCWDK